MALIFPRVPIVFTLSSFDWMQLDTLWARISWESRHFRWYPDKGWKLSTVNKVCSRVDHTGSAVLRKSGSGTGRPARLPVLQRLHLQFVVRCKTIFPLVGSTELNNVSKTLILKSQTVIDCLHWDTQWGKNDVISEKLHFHFLGE